MSMLASNNILADCGLSSETGLTGSPIASRAVSEANSGMLPVNLVAIDRRVEGYADFITNALPNTEILLLDPEENGVAQITGRLAQRHSISGLHIVTHAEAGNVQIGSTQLNGGTLSQYANQFEQWAGAFTSEADLLFYGCNIAESEEGVQFIEALSHLTGADVAASSNRTGSKTLNGDWELEVQTGAIEASLAFASQFLASYGAVLDTQTVNFTDFSDITNLTLNGNASRTSNNILQLTPALSRQAGSAFLSDAFAINADTSFQTRFQVQFLGGTGGADGLTFMLQNSAAGAGALGVGASYLGYGDINQSLAIELDTFRSTWDINANHVSVLQNGNVPNALATATPSLDLNSDTPLNVWVDYDGATNQLQVFLSQGADKPTSALLSYTTDLAATVGSQAFIGFSAGTGGRFNAHTLRNWQLSVSDLVSTGDTTPPTASLTTSNIMTAGGTSHTFTVSYSDNTAIDVSTLDGSDVRVTGPNGFDQLATLVSVNAPGNGSPRTATYQINAPSGSWDTADNGIYTVALQANQIRDTAGNLMPEATLGRFQVDLSGGGNPGTLALLQNRFTVNENAGNATVTIVRTGGSDGTVSVDYTTVNDTSQSGSDYTEAAGTLVFAPGEVSKTISIPIRNDIDLEGDETFSFAIDRPEGGAALGAPRTALVTIVDDERPLIGDFTLSYDTFADVSRLKRNGSAVQAGNILRLTPDLSSRAGSAFFDSPIAINADTSFQSQFQFRISGSRGTVGADGMTFILQNTVNGANTLGGIASALGYGGTGTGSLAIEFDTYDNGEFDPNGNHVSILRNGITTSALATATAPIDLNSGSPINAWIDYNGTTNQLNVSLSTSTAKPTTPLLSQTIDLAAIVGSSAFIGFSAGSGGQYNIHDINSWQFTSSATPPSVGFAPSAISVNEGAGGATLTLRRGLSGGSGAATVDYAVSNGTAIAGDDYTGIAGTVSFAAGESSKTINIPLLNDTTPERNENFTVTLSNPRGMELGSVATATVTIVDDDPGNFVRETIVSGLAQPTAIDWSPDGQRMYIAQKGGIVRMAVNGVLQATPFIDISSQVNSTSDRGLLGLAVHPNFPSQPYVYLLYTYDPPETRSLTGLAGPDGRGNRPSRLVRFEANPATNYTTAIPGSEVVILGKNSIWAYTSRPDLDSTGDLGIVPSGIVNGTTITAPASQIDVGTQDNDPARAGIQNQNIRDYLATDSSTHSIGSIRFGTDGSLFVSNGDGTSYGRVDPRTVRVQDIDNLSGKLLRIDPITGEGLSDNPFYNGDPNSNRSKVYSYGLRNPFRFTINPKNNEPYIGDVGWTQWEEVNTGRGANFGWPYYEGGNNVSLRTGGYLDLPAAQAFYASGQPVTAPILGRRHADGATALVLGDFYKGTTFPSLYQGSLFLSDLEGGTVDALLFKPDGTIDSVKRFATGLPFVVQMRSAPDSNLYYVSLGSGEIGRWRAA